MAYGQQGRPRAAPISPPRRPPSRAATSRPRASSPRRAKTRFPVGSPGWVKADESSATSRRKAPGGCDAEKEHRQCDSDLRPFAAALIAGAAGRCRRRSPPARNPSRPTQRGEIEDDHPRLPAPHPEVLQEVMAELEKRQAAAEAEKHRAAVKETCRDASSIRRARSTVGNPQGDVTLVEFFDYNCGYCKRAMTDMLELMKTDPKLKVVLKEFPVLGAGSVQAAQVAVAVRMQDKTAARNISNSTRSCSAAAARSTRRARSRSPRRSGSTWRGSRRTSASDEVQAHARGELQARRGARPQRHAELCDRRRRRGRRGRPRRRSRRRSTPRAAARRPAEAQLRRSARGTIRRIRRARGATRDIGGRRDRR